MAECSLHILHNRLKFKDIDLCYFNNPTKYTRRKAPSPSVESIVVSFAALVFKCQTLECVRVEVPLKDTIQATILVPIWYQNPTLTNGICSLQVTPASLGMAHFWLAIGTFNWTPRPPSRPPPFTATVGICEPPNRAGASEVDLQVIWS